MPWRRTTAHRYTVAHACHPKKTYSHSRMHTHAQTHHTRTRTHPPTHVHAHLGAGLDDGEVRLLVRLVVVGRLQQHLEGVDLPPVRRRRQGTRASGIRGSGHSRTLGTYPPCALGCAGPCLPCAPRLSTRRPIPHRREGSGWEPGAETTRFHKTATAHLQVRREAVSENGEAFLWVILTSRSFPGRSRGGRLAVVVVAILGGMATMKEHRPLIKWLKYNSPVC